MRDDLNIEYFKSRLEEDKALLIDELKLLGRINPDNPEDWEPRPTSSEHAADLNERADSFEESDENAAILSQLEAKFNETLHALKRIDDGSYGICTVGGEHIEKERLEAYPAASTCVEHSK